MAKGGSDRIRVASVIMAVVGAVLAGVPATADAQIAVGGRGESPADALARNMKTLGSSPNSFEALVGAGRASLALGDSQAAAGFFGRAEEVWPTSPLPRNSSRHATELSFCLGMKYGCRDAPSTL